MSKKPNFTFLEVLHEYGVDVDRRVCYLHGDVDADLAAQFVRNFSYLTSISSEPVYVDINSAGGSVCDGMGIFDTIAAAVGSGIVVHGRVRGEASSIACVVLQACSLRYAYKNAVIMHHRGTSSHPSDRSPDEHKSAATFDKKQFDAIDKIVYERVRNHYGKSLATFMKDTAKAIYMTAEEAEALGFVDYCL